MTEVKKKVKKKRSNVLNGNLGFIFRKIGGFSRIELIYSLMLLFLIKLLKTYGDSYKGFISLHLLI